MRRLRRSRAVRPAAGALSGVVGTMFGAMASIFFAMYLNACALDKRGFIWLKNDSCAEFYVHLFASTDLPADTTDAGSD